MASAPMTPPPGQDQGQGPDSGQGQPPDPSQASPASSASAPAQPSPQMQQGTQIAIRVVNDLRTIAKAFPGAAPAVAEIHDKMRDVLKAIMQQGTPGTPAAPPA